MPVLNSVDTDHSEWPSPLVRTWMNPLALDARFTSTWPDDDFLCWSSRQKDAEIVADYDV